jgi:cbb3-type cytochrome oxidase maturation protein
MSVIVILIFISLVVALGFLGAFIWAMRSGQYDDTSTPQHRMLFDQKVSKEKKEKQEEKKIDKNE